MTRPNDIIKNGEYIEPHTFESDSEANLFYSYLESRKYIDRLENTLKEIIDPIHFMSERLEDGEELNGFYAIKLADNPDYLREIAKRGLLLNGL